MDLSAALVAFGPWGGFVSRGGPTASHAHISSPLLVCLIQKGTRTGPRNPMMCSCTSSLCPTCTGAARSLPTSGGPMLLLAAFFLHRSSANTGAGHRIEAILQASTKAASSVVSTCTSIHFVLSRVPISRAARAAADIDIDMMRCFSVSSSSSAAKSLIF